MIVRWHRVTCELGIHPSTQNSPDRLGMDWPDLCYNNVCNVTVSQLPNENQEHTPNDPLFGISAHLLPIDEISEILINYDTGITLNMRR
jgi:hypothetical protein